MGNTQTNSNTDTHPKKFEYSRINYKYGNPYRLLKEHACKEGPTVIGLFDEYGKHLNTSLCVYYDDCDEFYVDVMIDTVRYPIYDDNVLFGSECRERIKSNHPDKTSIKGLIKTDCLFKYIRINLSSEDKFVKGSIGIDQDVRKFVTNIKVR